MNRTVTKPLPAQQPDAVITPEELLAECARAPASTLQALEVAELVLAEDLKNLLDGFPYRRELQTPRAVWARATGLALERVRSARSQIVLAATPELAAKAEAPTSADFEKTRSAQIRLAVIAAFDGGRPLALSESLIKCALADVPIGCDKAELRREIEVLERDELLTVDRSGPIWLAELTPRGIDAVNRLGLVQAVK